MDKGRKMDKKILTIELAVLLLVIGLLSGCAGNPFDPSAKFVGTWQIASVGDVTEYISGRTTLVFYPDGTYSFPGQVAGLNIEGTYQVKGGMLTMSGTKWSGTFGYSFSNNDRTLTLSASGTNMVLTKQ